MKKIYLLFPALLSLTACESLVEVDIPASQLGTSQVFENVQTANAAMAGLYAGLRDQSVVAGAGYYTMGTLLGSYTDDLDCYYNNTQAIMDIYLNQQDETNTIIKSIWKTAYQQVYYANSIIYGTEHSSSLSNDDKRRIKGESILVRSLIYFYLQQIFGDIPYTTTTDYKYNRYIYKTESSLVLEKLEADVEEAALLLKDDYQDSERIYPNRKAAQLLLARIYLLRSEWSQAEKMADTVLLSPLYQFQTDVNEVFHKSGKHILWQLMPKSSGDATTEALFYYFSNAMLNNVYTLSQDLVNSFTDGDLRKQAWMAEINYNGSTWYRPYKYKNLSGTNNNEYSVVFRLEEVYFIKAEALARQSRFDEALPYLNATRERAGLDPLTSLSDENFYTELLAEKRHEFFAEAGHRFLDLKRLGKLNELSTVKPNWEEYKQFWPLPQDEMLLNTNLAPQNVGY